MGTVSEIIRMPLLKHIQNRVKRLEKATSGIVCLQFADHPEGLSMVVRLYIPASEREFSYPDVILSSELNSGIGEAERINILFDVIHEALKSVQPVTSTSNGLIIH